ncbi:ABC transporter substrate-binding protein [candidate division KSB3 bacterium]|uniref:ABC transporter substrate-binding protein n=1 Tax=candidate division KSB3 bacterium TaxID=2044937 RepID=A0A9D5Q4M0_9BACT|nr:ABC transporter substrate-binding protein [candidate division KSB3 bacterium]MBD3323700.1 ABC transporter substrate-binding protein [candidate division KSB3 bacterium]
MENVRMKVINLWVILVACVVGLLACNSGQMAAEKRAEHAAEAQGEIVLGIVHSSNFPSLFLEGVNLAVEQLNQQGGILGRPLKTLVYDDEGDDQKGQQIAKDLADNREVVAVVGHTFSEVAIPVSIIYEKAGILFISPGASDPGLTRYGGNFTFRNIPSGEEIGRQIADFAFRHGVSQVAIFRQRQDAYKRLAESFSAHASTQNIETVTVRSFFGSEENFREQLSDIKRMYSFDAVLIIGLVPPAGTLIKQARDIGITVPILGTDGLDTPRLWTEAGRAAEGTVVVTVFNPDKPTLVTRNFVRQFKNHYGIEPDTWAAQGYDAIQLLAHAIQESGSTVPLVIASTLRFLENWHGVTGSYSFTRNGDITGKSVFFKVARNGSFEFLERETAADAEIDPLHVIEDITLRIPLNEPIDTIDPGRGYKTNSVEIIEQLFLGLTDFNPKTLQTVPELAESWTVSPDGTVYQFSLRPDVTWTDGTPVTAHDVVAAVHRNLHPDLRSPFIDDLYILQNAQAFHQGDIDDLTQVGVRAINNLTVEFTLEHAAVYFPAVAGLGGFHPIPRHVLEQYGEAWIDLEHIQTNGPYRPVFWDKGNLLILRKNLAYSEADNVAIPEVRYAIIAQSSIGFVMYQNNELDILGCSYSRVPKDEIVYIKANPNLHQEYSMHQKLCTSLFFFLTRVSPVDNLLVRKAIAAAIDRQLLVDLILTGDEQPATTLTPPGMAGAVTSREAVGIPFDPDQAKRWLAEAGYPDGKGLPKLHLFYDASDPDHAQIARAIQASLRHYLNIELQYEPTYQEGQTHLYLYSGCADYPDAQNIFNVLHPTVGYRPINWDQLGYFEEFSDALRIAQQSPDQQERNLAYQQAEKILTEDIVFSVPLYFDIAHCLVKPRVKGWYYMPVGGQHIRDWYFEE